MRFKFWKSRDKNGSSDIAKKAEESQQALLQAANSTMLLAQDVTVTLQEKLNDYASQIESTSRLISEALILVDVNGKIQSFNRAAEEIFGFKKQEIIGQYITKIFDLGIQNNIIDQAYMDKICELVNKEDFSKTTVKHECFMGIRKSGSKIYIEASANKLFRSDNTLDYLIAVRDVTVRVDNDRYTKRLAKKNNELLLAINASDTGIVILEPNGYEFEFAFTNSGFEKITGLSKEDIFRQNLRNVLGNSSGYWSIRKCLNAGISCNYEIEITDTSNHKHWVDVHVTPVENLEADKKQWIVVFYNITKLKQAYENLRKSEQHFRAFGEASAEALIIYCGDTILDWNHSLVKMTGYSNEELKNLNPLDLLHPLEREVMREAIHSDYPQQLEALFMTKEGDVREVAINSKIIEWQNTKANIAVVRDVTHFKDVNEQLRSSRERYKTVIDNTIDLVCCFNKDFIITFTNQTFREYFECESAVGFSLLDIIPVEDHENFKAYISSLTIDTPVKRGIHRVAHPESLRWTDWIDRAVFDEEGNLIEYQSVCRDIDHIINR